MFVLDGEAIKKQRNSLKLTQADVFTSTDCALSPSELSKIENGKKTTLVSPKLAELAKALGLSVDDILKEVEAPEKV